MRVLSVTNFNLGYSATMAERSLFTGLHSKGVDLTVVVANPNSETSELESAGIKVEYIPIKRKFDFTAIRKLRKLIIENRYDIIYLTYSKAMTNTIIASRGLKTKIIGYIGAISVYWHDPFAYLSFLNPRIDKMICLSNGVEKHMLRQAPFRMKGKTRRIYKGYDPGWFSNVKPVERAELDIPVDAMVICCVANVRKIKGIPYLIKSADFLPPGLPVYFVLVGPGMDSSHIASLIRRSQYADNFRVRGYTREVLSYTAACDLYIQPSLTEGLGRSVIEAMCLGKPVVVSGTGGVEELVEQGVTGFHVQAGSPVSIAEKINFLYSGRHMLNEMGTKARERIRTVFNPGKMVNETYDLFSSVAGD